MKVKVRVSPPAMYQNPIPLSKYKHLQELKAVIQLDFHSYYDNRPYKEEKKHKQK